jgi:hypothetical protein
MVIGTFWSEFREILEPARFKTVIGPDGLETHTDIAIDPLLVARGLCMYGPEPTGSAVRRDDRRDVFRMSVSSAF